jgi:hypothetical protein
MNLLHKIQPLGSSCGAPFLPILYTRGPHSSYRNKKSLPIFNQRPALFYKYMM